MDMTKREFGEAAVAFLALVFGTRVTRKLGIKPFDPAESGDEFGRAEINPALNTVGVEGRLATTPVSKTYVRYTNDGARRPDGLRVFARVAIASRGKDS